MSRVKVVIWTYCCDGGGDLACWTDLEVTKGDHVSTGRGTVVHDQADADAVARQAGWSVGRQVLCPAHAGGAS